MRMSFKNCIVSCAVAFLSVWPIACTSKVEVPGSCAAACEEKHPDSLVSLNKLKTGCACRTCNDACKQSVCFDKETPSGACLPCVQEGLSNQCSQHDGFFEGNCLGDKDCSELVACITACPR